MTQGSSIEKLAGCLLGTAIGDAMGLPAEGMSAARIRRKWRGMWSMRLVFDRGMLSDDTEHTYLTAQALAEQPHDAQAFQRALAAKLRWWFLALPAAVGLATAKACVKLCLGVSPENCGAFSAGNGPAMRSALIGVFFREDEEKRLAFVRASCRLTHTDPRAESAAQAVAAAAACAANDAKRDAFIATLSSFSTAPDWVEAMNTLKAQLALGATTQEYARAIGLEQSVSGYAFHTVPVALYGWLRHPADFATALTSVLECGGDTDTTGAIVGAIAGAALGPGAVPQQWRVRLCDFPLSLSQLDTAAEALATGGRVPSVFWPARLARNLVFLVVVVTHGLRRLLPPY